MDAGKYPLDTEVLPVTAIPSGSQLKTFPLIIKPADTLAFMGK